ncbi:pilin [Marinobacter algicola]|uniref:Pilin n=1 Tax=Marinobacter algicola DG893 TaxID=443152 RepID=A6F1J8_9GAMM|nr:pilin [Marinobacter algicola]EDM47399.1 fimbrillin [Marinobacter algicola DG893]
MTKQYAGFSLIEVMIVMAIIGILATLTIPLYHGNVLKSQVNRAISELSSYKAAFEVRVVNGEAVTNSNLGYVPSSLTTGSIATAIGITNSDGSGHMEVTLGDSAHPNLAGVILRLERDMTGIWTCKIDVSSAGSWREAYRPQDCSVL